MVKIMYALRSDDGRYIFDTDGKETEIIYETYEQATEELNKLEQFVPKGLFKIVKIE